MAHNIRKLAEGPLTLYLSRKKLISVHIKASCYMYVGINVVSGNYPQRNCVKEPVGILKVQAAALIDNNTTTSVFDVNTGDANYQGTYGVTNLESGNSVIKSYVKGTNEYTVTKCGLQIVYNGNDSIISQTQNFSWQQDIDYYQLNITAAFGMGQTSDDWHLTYNYGAVLSDGVSGILI